MLAPVIPLTVELTPGQRKVLDLIRQHGPVSRAKITEWSGLGSGSVTTICKELLSMQWIVEGERMVVGRGQPIVPVEISPYAAFSFGIAFYIARLEISLANFRGDTVDLVSFEYDESQPAEDTLSLLASSVQRLVVKHRLQHARILGVGVSMPGPQTADGKHVQAIAPMAHWRDIDLAEAFGRHFPWPVWIDNDCNVGAVGEFYSGKWSHVENMLLLEIGHGIGGGVIINGQLYRGKHQNAGEIGAYFTMLPDRRPCLRELMTDLRDAGLDAYLLSDIPALDHPIVAAWIKKSAAQLAPAIMLTLSWFDPDCIVFGGSAPKEIAEALIKEMNLEKAWSERSFDYPMATLSASRVGAHLSSFGASMYPVFQTIRPE